MNILVISNYYPSHPGGIEIVAQNLVTRWRKKHRVRWMACDVATYPYTPSMDDIPMAANNFTELKLGFPYPIPNIRSIFSIVKQVYWSDILHLHDCLYLANIIAFIFACLFTKPVIITQHVGLVRYKEAYKNLIQKFAYQTIGRFVLVSANEVIFVNESVMKWFEEEIKLPRISVVQNGIDHKIFSPTTISERLSFRKKLGISQNAKVLLFIGRFTQKKGMDIIKSIALSRPQYEWVIIGDGEMAINGWGFSNVRVFPHQTQQELKKFYGVADLFVLPSKGEGFPLTVQEALSCGLPCAVSQEIALSLSNAPLISLDTSSLPSLLITLDESLGNLDFLKLSSNQSREYSNTWDWDHVANVYKNYFKRALKREKK